MPLIDKRHTKFDYFTYKETQERLPFHWNIKISKVVHDMIDEYFEFIVAQVLL